jgi:RimJ/RimL family protein N-acetyltransferase
MNIRIETERLILRPFQEDDVDRIFTRSNPEVNEICRTKCNRKSNRSTLLKWLKDYATKAS